MRIIRIDSQTDFQACDTVSDTDKISRRQAARFLITATASGLVLPALALDCHPWNCIAEAAVSDSAEEALASENWKPLVLSAQQEQALRAIAETIVPGSTKALVSRFIDLLLSVETEIARKKFLGSLAAIDEAPASKSGKPFSKLSTQDQTSLLSAISSAPRSGDASSRMRGHFEDLKEWIVPAYYSSEIGMRELGWTPDRVFSSYPPCAHAENHS